MNNTNKTNSDQILRPMQQVISVLAGCFVVTVAVIALFPFWFDLPESGQRDLNFSIDIKLLLLLAGLGLGVGGYLAKRSFLKRKDILGLKEYLAAYLKVTLVAFTIFEMIAISGLVFWLTYGDRIFASILSIVALLFMFLSWPRSSDFVNTDVRA